MAVSRFTGYLLRTTDVEAATAFYDAVLERRGDGIAPLPEMAIARGARPHWLGHISVREVGGSEAVAARFVERGAMRLGPPGTSDDVVVFRDPGGAPVAITSSAGQSSAGVVWHQLNTNDPGPATENYSALFGWSFAPEVDLGQLGRHRRFAFRAGESNAGLFSDIAGRPGVHPHWLFYFAVKSLAIAVDRVRTHGGIVVGPIELPNGVRIAVCDDRQGAAFGLVEPGDAASLANEGAAGAA